MRRRTRRSCRSPDAGLSTSRPICWRDACSRCRGGWDWPVRRAALEAILRRVASIRAQEIAVVEGPRGGPWGRYVLGRADAEGALPYDVRLASLAPVRGSCDCADFLRGALGLCKHVLAVLEHLAKAPRAFGRIMTTPTSSSRGGAIVWDPTAAPPTSIDPLDALGLTPPAANRRGTATVPSAIARSFHPAKTGTWRLKTTHGANPEVRMRLVRTLDAHARKARASADPAALAVLAEERARLERVLRLRAAAPRIRRALGRAKRRLYAYQKEGVSRFLAEGRLVLADDMGLGKTTQAIAGQARSTTLASCAEGCWWCPHRSSRSGNASGRRCPMRRCASWRAARTIGARSIKSTRRGFLVTNYEQVVRDLDTITALGTRPCGARRGPTNQELGDEDRAHRQAPQARGSGWFSRVPRWRTGSRSWPP